MVDLFKAYSLPSSKLVLPQLLGSPTIINEWKICRNIVYWVVHVSIEKDCFLRPKAWETGSLKCFGSARSRSNCQFRNPVPLYSFYITWPRKNKHGAWKWQFPGTHIYYWGVLFVSLGPCPFRVKDGVLDVYSGELIKDSAYYYEVERTLRCWIFYFPRLQSTKKASSIKRVKWIEDISDVGLFWREIFCIISRKGPTKNPSEWIVLDNCHVELAESGEPYAFQITFGGDGSRTYILGADTPKEMESWMRAITHSNYEYLRMMVESFESTLAKLTSDDLVSSSANGGSNLTTNISGASGPNEVNSEEQGSNADPIVELPSFEWDRKVWCCL